MFSVSMLAAAIRAEWMKYRRTLTPWFVIGGPLLLVLAELVIWMLAPYYEPTWPYKLLVLYNWWVVLGLPFGLALIASLSASYERRAKMWSVLRAYPIHPGLLYAAKFVVLAAQSALANLLFVFFIFVVQSWLLEGPVPWRLLATGMTISWIASLAILALMQWIATASGFALTFSFAFIGMATSLLTDEKPFWLLHPWSWPVRALQPVYGFHANGLPLEPDSPLWDLSVVPLAGVLGIVLAVVFVFLGAIWFQAKDVNT